MFSYEHTVLIMFSYEHTVLITFSYEHTVLILKKSEICGSNTQPLVHHSLVDAWAASDHKLKCSCVAGEEEGTCLCAQPSVCCC